MTKFIHFYETFNNATTAIRLADASRNTSFILVYRKPNFHCIPKCKFLQGDHAIINLTRNNLQEGLLSKQWSRIQTECRRLIKKGVIT